VLCIERYFQFGVPGKNTIKIDIEGKNLFETAKDSKYLTIYYLSYAQIAKIKAEEAKDAKEKAQWEKEKEEAKYTKDSPARIMLNTTSVDTSLTSAQIEANRNFYNGKIVKNWKLGVSDVTKSQILSQIETFVPGLGQAGGGSHGFFDINVEDVKYWGKYS